MCECGWGLGGVLLGRGSGDRPGSWETVIAKFEGLGAGFTAHS